MNFSEKYCVFYTNVHPQISVVWVWHTN